MIVIMTEVATALRTNANMKKEAAVSIEKKRRAFKRPTPGHY